MRFRSTSATIRGYEGTAHAGWPRRWRPASDENLSGSAHQQTALRHDRGERGRGRRVRRRLRLRHQGIRRRRRPFDRAAEERRHHVAQQRRLASAPTATASSRCRQRREAARCRCCSSSTAPPRAARACCAASVRRRTKPASSCWRPIRAAPRDAIRGSFGEDVEFLNRALEHVFRASPLIPRGLPSADSRRRVLCASLGLASGDLSPRVVACSPGFVISAAVHGRPRFFVSHGTSDQILPIDQCSRVIVPRLKSMGYDVTFREFDGRHELPPAVAQEAMQWLAAK